LGLHARCDAAPSWERQFAFASFSLRQLRSFPAIFLTH
jgi:hypothetical protein